MRPTKEGKEGAFFPPPLGPSFHPTPILLSPPPQDSTLASVPGGSDRRAAGAVKPQINKQHSTRPQPASFHELDLVDRLPFPLPVGPPPE